MISLQVTIEDEDIEAILESEEIEIDDMEKAIEIVSGDDYHQEIMVEFQKNNMRELENLIGRYVDKFKLVVDRHRDELEQL